MKLFKLLFLVVALVSAPFSFAENVNVGMEQGGNRLFIKSGGEIDVESGGSFKLAGTAVTSTAAELNLVDGADRMTKVARIALAAVDTGGGLFAWANPTGGSILVTKVILDVTTEATGSCTADIGVAANGTTSADTLLDGVNLGAAVGIFDNIDDQGTNGLATVKATSSQFVTGSVASGASAGIVGFAYIHYHEI